ncbi:MAG: P-type conjugative transfer protein TrbJ [Sphingomonadales bacterium 32-68-7]|nr:MAG: P-type conjugative transfer protein TrbJ [Sphingomonadales bacterium 12-68-11]OYX10407.1 MAG: P-type conjugative transfer protein TrbJ [Sphingomonadales bacterium 32-68-7]
MKTFATALALASSAPLALAIPAAPAAAMPVFDATNYAQNLLQAARALEQINHQIQSLQNEAAMIQTMARNLERIDFPQLQKIRSALERIDGLMEQAQAIDFRIDRLDQQVRALFPGTGEALGGSAQQVERARARLGAAMSGYRHAMTVQAQIAENVGEDAALLEELVARSQGASGALQAQQASSQLLALGIKQQLQLQTLMTAEFRSQAIERSRRAQAEADGRATTRRFLGTRSAYARVGS